ncbi:MAG: AraC family transcriptional regulator [Prevotella sp.]|nr:AraC family transcriptional regulator [Prevotella sp.]
MKLIYLNRHASCPHYIGSSPVGFGELEADNGEELQCASSFGMVVMLLEGEAMVVGKDGPLLRVSSHQMFTLPPHHKFTIHVLQKSRAIRLNIIGNKLDFCHRVVSEEQIRQTDSSLYALPMLPVVHTFADQMGTYIHDKLLCCEIHQLKQRELSALLQAYYRPMVLQRFLAPLYANDSSFIEKVMELSTNFLTVDQMAEQLNMSRSTFVRNFSNNFNESPLQWLTRIRTKA